MSATDSKIYDALVASMSPEQRGMLEKLKASGVIPFAPPAAIPDSSSAAVVALSAPHNHVLAAGHHLAAAPAVPVAEDDEEEDQKNAIDNADDGGDGVVPVLAKYKKRVTPKPKDVPKEMPPRAVADHTTIMLLDIPTTDDAKNPHLVSRKWNGRISQAHDDFIDLVHVCLWPWNEAFLNYHYTWDEQTKAGRKGAILALQQRFRVSQGAAEAALKYRLGNGRKHFQKRVEKVGSGKRKREDDNDAEESSRKKKKAKKDGQTKSASSAVAEVSVPEAESAASTTEHKAERKTDDDFMHVFLFDGNKKVAKAVVLSKGPCHMGVIDVAADHIILSLNKLSTDAPTAEVKRPAIGVWTGAPLKFWKDVQDQLIVVPLSSVKPIGKVPAAKPVKAAAPAAAPASAAASAAQSAIDRSHLRRASSGGGSSLQSAQDLKMMREARTVSADDLARLGFSLSRSPSGSLSMRSRSGRVTSSSASGSGSGSGSGAASAGAASASAQHLSLLGPSDGSSFPAAAAPGDVRG